MRPRRSRGNGLGLASYPALNTNACSSGVVPAVLVNGDPMFYRVQLLPSQTDWDLGNNQSSAVQASRTLDIRLGSVTASVVNGSLQIVANACNAPTSALSESVAYYLVRPIDLLRDTWPSNTELLATSVLPSIAPNTCANATINVPLPLGGREYRVVAVLDTATTIENALHNLRATSPTFLVPVAVCGDGSVQAPEACDDGDTANNDGCSSMCAVERCGDGVQQTSEGCDDGNNADNDGSNATCVVERCGDGVLQTSEACDDGNTANNDGCSATCAIERCGDAIVQTGEGCDDGNTANNDGCSSACEIESSNPVCGDDVVQAPEACDDGNTADGDGCGATCIVETSETPWASNEHGNELIADGYDYVLGYNFTPLVDGHVTALGARVRGTKSVRLFHRNTQQEIARADVTANYQWSFTNIAPVRLTAGETYIVAVYTAGTGGVFRSHLTLPITYQNIRIESGAYELTSNNPNAFPYYYTFQAINGQADIRFAPIAR